MKQIVEAPWLAEQVASPKADGIVSSVKALIASGALHPGAQLPTVRDMASALHVSPSTVMSAWQKLRADGLIETHRRGGTIVRSAQSTAARNGIVAEAVGRNTLATRHYGRSHGGHKRIRPVADSADWAARDFSRASADPALQPDLGRALAAGLRVANLHGTEREPILGVLKDAVKLTWPFEPEAWVSAGGGTEGIVLALQVIMQPGDAIAIENPTSPRLRGILATLALKAVPIDCDDDGPLPQALAEALATTPSIKAFLYQPRAQMPTGRSVSEARSEALADVIANALTHARTPMASGISDHAAANGAKHTPDPAPALYIIEDDHLGSVTHTPLHSLAVHHPSHCVLVRAYCRAFGLDLRTSIIGGSHRLIERIEAYRNNRLAMPSRILQGALAYLLSDNEAVDCLHRARDIYEARRRAFAKALAALGLTLPPASGLVVWLPVADESHAIVNLAMHGIIVAGGSGCFVGDDRQPYIRVSISQLPDDETMIDAFAQIVASAIRHTALEEFD